MWKVQFGRAGHGSLGLAFGFQYQYPVLIAGVVFVRRSKLPASAIGQRRTINWRVLAASGVIPARRGRRLQPCHVDRDRSPGRQVGYRTSTVSRDRGGAIVALTNSRLFIALGPEPGRHHLVLLVRNQVEPR